MPKSFIKIAAFLLVPCLIADPSLAAAYAPWPAPKITVSERQNPSETSLFNHQALVGWLEFFHLPILRKRSPHLQNELQEAIPKVESGEPKHEPAAAPPRVVVADKIDVNELGVPGVIDVSKSSNKVAEIIRLSPEILIVRSATTVRQELIKQLPNLKVIIRAGHGTDNVDTNYALERGIRVLKTGGSEDAVTALAMRMIARALQREVAFDQDAAPASFYSIAEWQNAFKSKIKPDMSQELVSGLTQKADELFQPIGQVTIEALRGKTIGIIGFGEIARQLAAAAKDLDMEVRVYSPSLAENPQKAADAGYRFATPDEMYQQCHFVVPIMGLNKSGPKRNVQMLDARVMGLLKENPHFVALINVDRRELVDEAAMARLLSEKSGVRYLLDEVPEDPYLLTHALYTPHIGASTATGERNVVSATARLLAPIYRELSELGAAAPKPRSLGAGARNANDFEEKIDNHGHPLPGAVPATNSAKRSNRAQIMSLLKQIGEVPSLSYGVWNGWQKIEWELLNIYGQGEEAEGENVNHRIDRAIIVKLTAYAALKPLMNQKGDALRSFDGWWPLLSEKASTALRFCRVDTIDDVLKLTNRDMSRVNAGSKTLKEIDDFLRYLGFDRRSRLSQLMEKIGDIPDSLPWTASELRVLKGQEASPRTTLFQSSKPSWGTSSPYRVERKLEAYLHLVILRAEGKDAILDAPSYLISPFFTNTSLYDHDARPISHFLAIRGDELIKRHEVGRDVEEVTQVQVTLQSILDAPPAAAPASSIKSGDAKPDIHIHPLAVPDHIWAALANPGGGDDAPVYQWLGEQILKLSPELKGSLALDLYSLNNAGPSAGLLKSGLAGKVHMISRDAGEFRNLEKAPWAKGGLTLVPMDVKDLGARYAANSIGVIAINRLSFTGSSFRPHSSEKIMAGAEEAYHVLVPGGALIIRSEESRPELLNKYLLKLEGIGFSFIRTASSPNWKSVFNGGRSTLLPDHGLSVIVAMKPAAPQVPTNPPALKTPPYGIATGRAWGKLLLGCLSGGGKLAKLAVDPLVQLLIDLYPPLKDLVESRNIGELEKFLAFTVGPEQETKILFIDPAITLLRKVRSVTFLHAEHAKRFIQERVWKIVLHATEEHRWALFPGIPRLVELTDGEMGELALEIRSWTVDLEDYLFAYGTHPAPVASAAKEDLKRIEEGLSARHRRYNQKVHALLDGYTRRPYAIVPEDPSGPHVSAPTHSVPGTERPPIPPEAIEHSLLSDTHFRISRRHFAGFLGMMGLVTSRYWFPPLEDSWEKPALKSIDEDHIRATLLDALEQVDLFRGEIPGLNLAPALTIGWIDVLDGVLGLWHLLKTGVVEKITDPTSHTVLRVSAEANIIMVDVRVLKALSRFLNDTLLHEAVHTSPPQRRRHQVASSLMRQLEPLIQKYRRPELESPLEQKVGRPLSSQDIVELGVWDLTALLHDSASREIYKALLRIKFTNELEAYAVELSLLSERARRENPPISLSDYLRRQEERFNRAGSLGGHIRRWLKFPFPLEIAMMRSNAVLAAHFQAGTLTTQFLDQIIRLLVTGSENGFYKDRIVLIYRAEKDPRFTWESLRGENDPTTQAFFAWARSTFFDLNWTLQSSLQRSKFLFRAA